MRSPDVGWSRSKVDMQLLRSVALFPLLALIVSGGACETPANGQSPTAPAPNTGTQIAEARPNQPQLGLQSRPSVPVGPEYRIGAGDVIRVAVWDEPQFTTSAVVRPDGKISIPLVSDLLVANLTPDEAERLLTDQLTRLVKHPRVTVIVEEVHSRIVYITGEVQHPGAYALIGPMNVVQLIARSGGTTEFAKKKDIYVLHQDDGMKVKVDYQALLAGKHLEENIGLVPGDTVVVP
jgi:polysaccharide export outer membrane protein